MHNPVLTPLNAVETELRLRLQEVRVRYPAIDTPAVGDLVRAVLAAVAGEIEARESSLFGEFQAVGRMIAAARQDIASLEVADISDSHIPVATDELDAVVAHTALATDQILEVCETLDRVAESLSDVDAVQALRHATTQIYEACSFQDITGQRINKVTEALKAIDNKVALILGAFRLERGPDEARPIPAPLPTPAETPTVETVALLGPQMPTVAMAQVDIDRLLASFE